MLRPLVLSGGPAVGKSTCGRLLAAGRSRSAFIDADDIRQLVVSSASTLWRDQEGERQFVLAARNTAALARNLHAEGFEVVIADFVTAASLDVYRNDLPPALVVQLDISLAGAKERAATRKVYLTDREFDLLHSMMTSPPAVDVRLDVEGMTVDEQVARLDAAWAAAPV